MDMSKFTNITDTGLEQVIRGVLARTPNAGETYVAGGLRSQGICIPRSRLRQQLTIIDPIGRELRRRKAIRRRVYNVGAPNHLW